MYIYRVLEAVEKYYKSDFLPKWKYSLDNHIRNSEKSKNEDNKSPTVKVMAALVVERQYKKKIFQVHAFGQGTKHKNKCSFEESEDVWVTCDGHAEATCFQFANEYLLSEMHKCCCLGIKDATIFDQTLDGFKVKENVRFHLFVSHPPCGFMTNTNLHFMSWKEFENKPHCLQCSSKILINSFLGIQGYLSHLLVEPIYISHVVFPHNESFSSLIQIYMNELKFQPQQIDCYSFKKPIIVTFKSEITLENYRPVEKLRKGVQPQAIDKQTTRQDATTPRTEISQPCSSKDETIGVHTAASQGTSTNSSKGTTRIFGSVPGSSSCSVYSLKQTETRLKDNSIKEISVMISQIKKELNLQPSVIQHRLQNLKSAQDVVCNYIEDALTKQSAVCQEKFKGTIGEGKDIIEEVSQHIQENKSKLDTVSKLFKQVETTTKRLTDIHKKLESVLNYEKMYDILKSQKLSSMRCDCDWRRHEKIMEEQ